MEDQENQELENIEENQEEQEGNDLPEVEEFDDDETVNREEEKNKPAERRKIDRDELFQASIARAEKVEREIAEIRKASMPPSEEQRLLMEEDQILKDPNADPQEKWRIQGNRQIRASYLASQKAAFEVQDMKDRYNFMSKKTSDPRREKYEDRIEKELEQQRAQGKNVDRETLYFYLLGKDISSGKFKQSPKKPNNQASVPRGKSLQARSDVKPMNGSKGKLYDRLANKII